MSPVEMREADLAFWIGFCNEKMACAMSSWPSSYREEDITAFLPTCPGPNVSWKVGEASTEVLMVWCFEGTILATDSMAWHVSEFFQPRVKLLLTIVHQARHIHESPGSSLRCE